MELLQRVTPVNVFVGGNTLVRGNNNNMEVDKKVKIFVSYINTHQKICTMKEALKNQVGKLTQPLT